MLSPSSGSTKDSESPATRDDGGSPPRRDLQTLPPTRPVPPRPPPPIAATLYNGPPHASQATEASPMDLRRTASHGGQQPDLGSAADKHGKLTLPAVPDASGVSPSVGCDDRPSDRKELTSSLKTTDGVLRRENQHDRQPQGGPAPGDDTKRISVLPGQVAVVGKHPSAASGEESTSKPASAILAPAPPLMTPRPMIEIDSTAPSTAPRLILTKDKGIVPAQLLPQADEAVRSTAAPPLHEQGGMAAKSPLQLGATVLVGAKKEERLSSDDTSRRSHDDHVHAMLGRSIQPDESTSSDSHDSSSSPAKRTSVNVRHPRTKARPTSQEPKLASLHVRRESAESISLPIQARHATEGSIHAPVDHKGPSVHVRRASAESIRSPVEARHATEGSIHVPVDHKGPSVHVRRASAESIRSPVEGRRATDDSIHVPIDDKGRPAHVRRASAEAVHSPVEARRATDDSIQAPIDDKGRPAHVRRASAEAVHSPVEARRVTDDSIQVPVDDKGRPAHVRRATEDTLPVPIDGKGTSVHATHKSTDSGHPPISSGEPPLQQVTSKTAERDVMVPSEKAETVAVGHNAKRSLTEEVPPPPPPSADGIGASTRAAASSRADMKRTGSIAPTPLAQSSAPPKSSWWPAFANPFSLAAADAVPPAGGHEEAAAPSHAHRHSVAVTENQRALGRTNLRMKRAPVIAEELREYAAALDTGGGAWTGSAPVAPLATTGGAAPQQTGLIEDYLDYEHGPQLLHSLDSEVSIYDTSRRRRKRRTCAGLLGRCVLLLILVMVPCTLLFLTFRLGQLLYKNTPQYNVAQTTTTNATTNAATAADTTTVPKESQTTASASTTTSVSTIAATTTPSATTIFPPMEELYDDTSDRDPSCAEPVYTAGANLTDVVDFSSRSYTNRTATQYRKLLCVLDSKYFSPRRLYVLEQLPTAYCSELIYYALYVTSTVKVKRGRLDSEIFDAIVRLRERRLHRGKKMRLHIALGGSRRDSPSLVRLMENYEVRDAVINDLHALSRHYDGVAIHWDRPGDACDKEFTRTFFRALIEDLRRRRLAVILIVPPVVELVRRFWLINIMRYLEYVIVLTHTLRRKELLDCPGRRQFAAASYHAVREHVFKETSNPLHAAKVVYSISLGADVFKATLPLNYPRLLDAATPSSVFNGPTVQTYKTSYDHVCRLPKHAFDNDGECVWVLGASSASGTEIALYSGPEELTLRMRRSYADRIGDTTVAVYDLFLDDFDSHCSRPGQQGVESPLVAAIAEASLPH